MKVLCKELDVIGSIVKLILKFHHASLTKHMSNTVALWSEAAEENHLSCCSLLVSREAGSCATIVTLICDVSSCRFGKILLPLVSVLVHKHSIVINIFSFC